MKRQFSSVIFLIGFLCCSAAPLSKVDSLKKLERDGMENAAHVDILNQLSWELHRTDVQRSKGYAEKARTLAQSIGYQKGHSRALNLLAISISNEGKLATAIELNEKGLAIAEAIKDTFLISATTNDLANSFAGLGNHEKALSFYQRSLKLSELEGDTLGIAFTLGNIALLHGQIGNEELALDYLLKAATVARNSSDPMVMVTSQRKLGSFYLGKEDYDQALDHYRRGFNIATKAADRWSMAILKSSMARIHQQKANFEIAENDLNEAISLARELGDVTLQAGLWTDAAQLLLDSKQTQKGIEAAGEALAAATASQQIELLPEILITLGRLHHQDSNYKLAYEFNDRYLQLRDSLQAEQQALKIAELEQLYQTRQQAAQNQLLIAEQDKNKAIVSRQKSMQVAIMIIVTLLFFLLFTLFRVMQSKKTTQALLESTVTERTLDLKKRTNELKATVAELERFNYVASHDIKEPMRVVGGLSGMIHRRLPEQFREKFAEDFRLINLNLNQLYDLLEDISALGKIKRETADLRQVDLKQLVETVTTLLSEQIYNQHAVIESKELPQIPSNSSLLFIILKNLVENGIKYNESPVPMIKIDYNKLEGYHRISVADNGIGIEKPYTSKIFDLFTRLHERGKSGSGIGLALVKTAVTKLGGFIQLESTVGRGSTFFVYLPLREVSASPSH